MSDSHEAIPAPQDSPAAATSAADQHPVLVYTTWRLAIFIVVLVVLYLVGLREVWLIVFAFLISGIASIFVLNNRRQRAVGGISSVFRKVNDRIDASATAEDDNYLGDAAPGAGQSAGDHEPNA